MVYCTQRLLASARRQGALGSEAGATGGITGGLRAGVERAGPNGAPGFTASIGGNLAARVSGQAGIGAGSHGYGGAAGYPAWYGAPWGGAYGGYGGYGVPYGGGYYGFNPYIDYGSTRSRCAKGPPLVPPLQEQLVHLVLHPLLQRKARPSKCPTNFQKFYPNLCRTVYERMQTDNFEGTTLLGLLQMSSCRSIGPRVAVARRLRLHSAVPEALEISKREPTNFLFGKG
ncbi:hypothetical protein MTO96_047420 [Rhipicephalus appendiculatus]